VLVPIIGTVRPDARTSTNCGLSAVVPPAISTTVTADIAKSAVSAIACEAIGLAAPRNVTMIRIGFRTTEFMTTKIHPTLTAVNPM